MATETERFLSWHEQEQAKGLVDIKFFTSDVSSVTSESFFGEANQMVLAESIVSDKYNDNVERVEMCPEMQEQACK